MIKQALPSRENVDSLISGIIEAIDSCSIEHNNLHPQEVIYALGEILINIGIDESSLEYTNFILASITEYVKSISTLKASTMH